MNCCDEVGNCRQGRDCPVRKARAEANADTPLVSWISDGGLSMLIMLGSSTAVVAAVTFGVMWLTHR